MIREMEKKMKKKYSCSEYKTSKFKLGQPYLNIGYYYIFSIYFCVCLEQF